MSRSERDKKSHLNLSKVQIHLVILAPLVKCSFNVNTKTKINVKTDNVANQFPGIRDMGQYVSIINQYMRHCYVVFIVNFEQMFCTSVCQVSAEIYEIQIL